ncbi:MAG: hypothetical protein KY460_01655 [Actinobacteria bacterium]|nr:hypothetical protein [Actinomycetota bacterium]
MQTDDGAVVVIDGDTGRRIGAPLEGAGARSGGLAFSPDGTLLAIATHNGVRRVDVPDEVDAPTVVAVDVGSGRRVGPMIFDTPGRYALYDTMTDDADIDEWRQQMLEDAAAGLGSRTVPPCVASPTS